MSFSDDGNIETSDNDSEDESAEDLYLGNEQFENVDPVDYIAMAKEAVHLTLNNKFLESDALIRSNIMVHPLLSGAFAFNAACCAIVKFDDETVYKSRIRIKKIVSLIKRQFFNHVTTKYFAKTQLGDCYTYIGILYLFRTESRAYLRGGWYLRKAWKYYNSVYKTVNSTTFMNLKHLIDEERNLIRCGNACGYGLFHLCVSLVPTRILSLFEMFGLPGERETGLEELSLSHMNKQEPHSAISSFVLLWYYVFVQPYVTLTEFSRGVSNENEGLKLMAELSSKFHSSPFYAVFQVQMKRNSSNFSETLEICKQSIETFTGSREIQLLFVVQLGWTNLGLCLYKQAAEAFHKIYQESKWSHNFYLYLASICAAAENQKREANKLFGKLSSLKRKNSAEVHVFIVKRLALLKKIGLSAQVCQLLCLEVLYHWMILDIVPDSSLTQFLALAETFEAHPQLESLSCFIQGVIHRIRGNLDESEVMLLSARTPRHPERLTSSVSPYACLELVEIASQQKKFTQAKIYLLEARDNYQGYDFEQRLHITVYNYLNGIDRESDSDCS